jgi:hypothetical protein
LHGSKADEIVLAKCEFHHMNLDRSVRMRRAGAFQG